MKKNGLLSALLLLVIAAPASAAVIVSEVTPWGSGDTPYASDWFELTNTGAAAVDITGWRVDDSSPTFATAVALRGVTSIAPGKSVVFIEGDATGTNDAAKATAFILDWFNGTAPVGFVIGGYGGSGIGLGTGGDAVNIYDAGGALITGVTFGNSTGAPTGRTFDNAAGLSGPISLLSTVGTNGAFASGSSDVGSPGTIGAVPEPATLGLAALACFAMLGLRARRN